jgi:hypothetical protein
MNLKLAQPLSCHATTPLNTEGEHVSEIAYGPGEYDAEELEAIIRAEIEAVKLDANSGNLALPSGVSIDDVHSLSPDSVKVRPVAGGFAGEAFILIFVTIIVERIVDQLIIPRIKQKYGSRAIGTKKRADIESDDELDESEGAE